MIEDTIRFPESNANTEERLKTGVYNSGSIFYHVTFQTSAPLATGKQWEDQMLYMAVGGR